VIKKVVYEIGHCNAQCWHARIYPFGKFNPDDEYKETLYCSHEKILEECHDEKKVDFVTKGFPKWCPLRTVKK